LRTGRPPALPADRTKVIKRPGKHQGTGKERMSDYLGGNNMLLLPRVTRKGPIQGPCGAPVWNPHHKKKKKKEG